MRLQVNEPDTPHLSSPLGPNESLCTDGHKTHPPQTNQQEIHFMVKREENAKWIGV